MKLFEVGDWEVHLIPWDNPYSKPAKIKGIKAKYNYWKTQRYYRKGIAIAFGVTPYSKFKRFKFWFYDKTIWRIGRWLMKQKSEE